LDSECESYWFLKWFMLLKIQIISKKTRFWKEKSVEDVVTLGPTSLYFISLVLSLTWLLLCYIISYIHILWRFGICILCIVTWKQDIDNYCKDWLENFKCIWKVCYKVLYFFLVYFKGFYVFKGRFYILMEGIIVVVKPPILLRSLKINSPFIRNYVQAFFLMFLNSYLYENQISNSIQFTCIQKSSISCKKRKK
jgi:hypothetical protein